MASYLMCCVATPYHPDWYARIDDCCDNSEANQSLLPNKTNYYCYDYIPNL